MIRYPDWDDIRQEEALLALLEPDRAGTWGQRVQARRNVRDSRVPIRDHAPLPDHLAATTPTPLELLLAEESFRRVMWRYWRLERLAAKRTALNRRKKAPPRDG